MKGLNNFQSRHLIILFFIIFLINFNFSQAIELCNNTICCTGCCNNAEDVLIDQDPAGEDVFGKQACVNRCAEINSGISNGQNIQTCAVKFPGNSNTQVQGRTSCDAADVFFVQSNHAEPVGTFKDTNICCGFDGAVDIIGQDQLCFVQPTDSPTATEVPIGGGGDGGGQGPGVPATDGSVDKGIIIIAGGASGGVFVLLGLMILFVNSRKSGKYKYGEVIAKRMSLESVSENISKRMSSVKETVTNSIRNARPISQERSKSISENFSKGMSSVKEKVTASVRSVRQLSMNAIDASKTSRGAEKNKVGNANIKEAIMIKGDVADEDEFIVQVTEADQQEMLKSAARVAMKEKLPSKFSVLLMNARKSKAAKKATEIPSASIKPEEFDKIAALLAPSTSKSELNDSEVLTSNKYKSKSKSGRKKSKKKKSSKISKDRLNMDTLNRLEMDTSDLELGFSASKFKSVRSESTNDSGKRNEDYEEDETTTAKPKKGYLKKLENNVDLRESIFRPSKLYIEANSNLVEKSPKKKSRKKKKTNVSNGDE